jgi:hypothetical protein
MTQSTSRTGSASWSPDHDAEVNSERLASSFLSKQGMTAKCQILWGDTPNRFASTDLTNVPANAWGDFKRDR